MFKLRRLNKKSAVLNLSRKKVNQMNIKKNFVFLILGLLMTFLLPNYARAFTFSALDTQGRLLNFSNPVLIAGTAVAAGAGTASVGAKFKYTNVITINGTQVDAIVSVDNLVNITITKFDDPKPNPTPKNPAQRTLTGTTVNYITSFGGVVPEGAIFAPQLTAISHTADAHVDFTISFQDTSGKAVVLQNVYNNSLDDENVEYNEFGGFISYTFASDYKTNLVQHMVAGAGLNGKIRFSNSNCAGNAGLYITDSSRVQTRFNTVTSLKLTLGQFANGTAPTGIGSAVSTCANTGVRFYGAVFVKDGFKESGVAPFETIAPTVDLLTTSNTKPTITGSLGGTVTATSPTGIQTGSPLAAGETFSVTVNGVVYSSSSLVMIGANWSLTIPTALAVGTYEVSATRTGGLVDQSNNELTVTPICSVPQVLNLTLTACVLPSPSDVVLCHTGDIGDRNGDGIENSLDNPLRHYVKEIINPTGTTGHETHPNDVESTIGAAGRECPDDVPICLTNQILDAATKTCITAVRPTVNTTAATTLLAPALSGTVGTSSSLTITVNGVSGAATVNLSAGTWTYTPAILPIGTYDVVVTSNTGLTDATTNELTVTLACLSSQIVQGTACITPSVPTINSTTTNDKIAASLSGTLGTSTSLTITVNGVSGAATVNLSAGTWTYTPAILPNGTYNVIATGNTGLVDTTTNELVVSATTVPTVTPITFNDKQIPTITGTTGTSTAINVSVNGVSGAATVTGSTWSYTLPTALAANTYPVTATGNIAGLIGTGTLTVTATVAPTVNTATSTTAVAPALSGTVGTSTSLTVTVNGLSGAATINSVVGTWTYTPAVITTAGTYNVVVTGDSAHGSLVDTSLNELTVTQAAVNPTVTSGRTATDITRPTLTGTVGTSTSLTITVNDSTSGATYATGTAILSGTYPNKTWTYSPTNAIPAGTYNVVATGETGLVDTTTGELVVSGTQTNTACVASTNPLPSPLPTGSNYNSQNEQVKICQFTNATDTNVNVTTVDLNGRRSNRGAYVYNGFDTIWVSQDSNCPTTALQCKTKPTVVPKSITDQTNVTLNGTGDTGATSMTIVIKNSAGVPQTMVGTTTAKSSGSTTWTFSSTTTLPAGVYSVTATDSYGLVDITTNELTVTATAVNPTIVCPSTVTDAAVPVITGTFGTGSPLTITVKDSSGVQKATGTKTNSGTTTTTAWSFDSAVLPVAGTYTATATGVPTTLTASCTFPVTQTPIAPTVSAATATDLVAAHLSGTSGTSPSLAITISGKPAITCPAVIDAVAKTWTCTTSAAIPAGNYTVTATGTSGVGTGTLTVTASAVPTVNTKTTLDKIAPALSGNAGASTSLTITIKSTPEVTGAAIITGSTWTFTPSTPIAAGTYDVVALGNSGLVDATSNELTVTTCTIPQVYNAAGDACITPVPTVVSLNTNSSTPIITGTVGVVALGATESFSVLVNNKTYTKSAVATNPLVVNALNWTLTIPATDVIPAGTHEVEATRNTSKDITHNELVVNLVCTTPEIINSTHTACITPAVPTVNTTTTTDKIAAALTGSIGTSTSLVINVNDATGATQATGNAIITGTTWTFAPSSVLPAGIYNVVATGDTGLIDATTSELKVTATCSLPKVANAAGTVCVYPTPTVAPMGVFTKAQQPITLSGTVGTTALGGSESFTVTVGGVPYTQSTIVVSGITWSLQLPILNAGTYDVDVSRSGVFDETSKELVITDKIDICNGGTDQSIERTEWVDWKQDENYYLGKCKAPECTDPPTNTIPVGCTAPLPKNPVQACQDSLNPANDPLCPRIPDALVTEAVTLPLPPEVTYCYDDTGAITGIKSDASVTTSVTIKRARIANASTQDGTFDNSTLANTVVKYGTKQQGALVIESYTDSNGATITPVVTKGKVVGAKITGAVIAGAYIDIPNDYIDTDQSIKPSCLNDDKSLKLSCFIKVTGGITNPTSIKEGSATPVPATITNGMITSGTDSDGNPVRGSVTSGQFDKPITNSDTTITQGRRVKGQLMNAIIENATTTTVSGVTVVSAGNVISGEMDPETTATTFGTVTNATISGVKISSTNHCFSSGTVGSRGQLNWKEVVK